jgi:hypothetical protein
VLVARVLVDPRRVAAERDALFAREERLGVDAAERLAEPGLGELLAAGGKLRRARRAEFPELLDALPSLKADKA